MKPGRALAALLPLVVCFATGGGCNGTASRYDSVAWQCSDAQGGCACHGAPNASDRASVPGTPACAAELDCCFVVDHGDGSFDCTCRATPEDPPPAGAAGAGGEGGAAPERSQAARCASAAAAQNSTTLTPHCPPITLDSAGVCAVSFESCEPAYLKQNGLVACCDGTACRSDASGRMVCQPT